MATPNEIIQGLLNTAPKAEQGTTVDSTFQVENNPSLGRIANNGKFLTQNVSKLTQTLQTILTGWGVNA